MMADPFKKLSEEYKGRVTFAKLNCEAEGALDAASSEQITAYPTFRTYVNGKRVDELMGAHVQKLRTLVEGVLNHKS
jgi:thioredoxin-like negative regulator of GroEL